MLGNFVAEPGAGVSVLDRHGRIYFVNDDSVRIFGLESLGSEGVVGKTLDELFASKEWIRERITLFEQIAEDGQERLIRTVWEGFQQYSWIRLLDGDTESADPRFLVVTRRVPSGHEEEHLLQKEMPILESQVIALGRLEVLSPRELEVLALIGHGLTTKQIADTLQRSVKTIGNHRLSLGQKLNKSNKVELALMAREAGLRVTDSKRTRID